MYPTDRAKPGTKRSLLLEGDGDPLGVVVERPDPEEVEQHLCLGSGYRPPVEHSPLEQAHLPPRLALLGEAFLEAGHR